MRHCKKLPNVRYVSEPHAYLDPPTKTCAHCGATDAPYFVTKPLRQITIFKEGEGHLINLLILDDPHTIQRIDGIMEMRTERVCWNCLPRKLRRAIGKDFISPDEREHRKRYPK